MPGASILDLVEGVPRRERRSIVELAHSEPDVSGIAPHVWEAHEEAKRRLTQHGSAVAEITFKPDIGAFELVTEHREIADILRALGPGAKITIHF